MPRISAFYGIVIWMYFDEAHHSGRPHFHATYDDDEATIDIESTAIIAGGLPSRGRRLVIEWAHARGRAARELGSGASQRAASINRPAALNALPLL